MHLLILALVVGGSRREVKRAGPREGERLLRHPGHARRIIHLLLHHRPPPHIIYDRTTQATLTVSLRHMQTLTYPHTHTSRGKNRQTKKINKIIIVMVKFNLVWEEPEISVKTLSVPVS